MTVDPKIASRHMLGTDGLALRPNSIRQHIRIIITPRWAESAAGQLMAECLVNLLSRQVVLIERIEVVSPAVALLIHPVVKGVGDTLPAYLKALGAWSVGMEVLTASVSTSNRADQTVVIGTDPMQDCTDAIVCIADGWKAWIGRSQDAPQVSPSLSGTPIGPLFAGALVAGEIFKKTWGLRRGRFLESNGYSLWTNNENPSWDKLDAGPELPRLHISSFLLVGCGAVGNVFAYVLAHLKTCDAYPVLLDDDSYDTTNLNRCLLAGTEDLKKNKGTVLALRLKEAGIESFPFDGRLMQFVGDPRRGLRADLAEEIDNGHFPMVVSCVDKGDGRQDIQGLSPLMLFGGSTLDLQAKTNTYAGESNAACLGCHNPREHRAEAMVEIERELRAMSPEARTTFLRERDLDTREVELYLNDPQCGQLGRAALLNFAATPPPEFSVGFVSLGAGVLLAANVFRTLLSPEKTVHSSAMITFNFLNGNLLVSALARDHQCELCGSKHEVAVVGTTEAGIVGGSDACR